MNENAISYIIHLTGKTKSQILNDFEIWNKRRKNKYQYMTEIDKLFYFRQIVCEFYKVDSESLNIKCRDIEYLLPRQVIHYFAKDLRLSRKIIAKHIGNLSGYTIYNSVKSINDRIETNKNFRVEIEELEKLIMDE